MSEKLCTCLIIICFLLFHILWAIIYGHQQTEQLKPNWAAKIPAINFARVHASCISTIVWFWFSTSYPKTETHSKTGSIFVSSTHTPLTTTFTGLRNRHAAVLRRPRKPGAEPDRWKLDSCPLPLTSPKRQNLGQDPRGFTDFPSCSSFIDSAPGYKIKQW